MLRYCLCFSVLVVALCGNIAAAVPLRGMLLTQSAVEEMVQVTRQRSLAPPISAESLYRQKQVYSKDVQAYLRRLDRWSSWLDKNARLSLQGTLESNRGTVGMALLLDRSHKLVCIPYPGGPAAKAGVHAGDVLVEVDGVPMDNATLSSAALFLVREPGSSVNLTLKRHNFYVDVLVIREKVTAPHVKFTQENGFARIRIWDFTKNTPQLLRTALAKVGKQPLVLDVRGNSGGSIVSALTCAAEFLPKDTLISLTHQRPKANKKANGRTITKRNGAFIKISPIYIWQDTFTASSAEAFIAALVDTGYATSIGVPSFGKSYVQENFNIEGHTLTLSTKALYAPSGESWEDNGLVPTIRFRDTSTEGLLVKTWQILNN